MAHWPRAGAMQNRETAAGKMGFLLRRTQMKQPQQLFLATRAQQ